MLIPQLENLVESGLRRSCTVSEHGSELRALAERVSSDEDLHVASGIFGALSSPARLTMLKLLAPRPLCVCEISFALRMTQPTTSHHLQILERAGLIEAQPKGKWTFYRIADRRALQMVEMAARVNRNPSESSTGAPLARHAPRSPRAHVG